jgi:hypothetical protein
VITLTKDNVNCEHSNQREFRDFFLKKKYLQYLNDNIKWVDINQMLKLTVMTITERSH